MLKSITGKVISFLDDKTLFSSFVMKLENKVKVMFLDLGQHTNTNVWHELDITYAFRYKICHFRQQLCTT